MKKTDKTIKKLAAYSTAAIAVLATTPEANAELIGYDVNPDSVILFPQDTGNIMYYIINMNNVGTTCDNVDNLFVSLWYGGTASTSVAVWGSVYDSGAAYGNWNFYYNTGQTITYQIPTSYGGYITTTIIGTTTSWYATAIVNSSGSSIGPSSPPNQWIDNTYFTHSWWYSGTNWGQWQGGKDNKYMGLRFYAYNMDLDSVPGDTIWSKNLHYGWVYMSIGINSSMLKVQALVLSRLTLTFLS